MILNLGSLAFNANIANGGGTPTWGTELGQGDGYRFNFEEKESFLTSMLYTSINDINQVTCPLGKGGSRQDDYEFVLASVYDKIFVNGLRVPSSKFVLLIVKQVKGEHHIGRRSLKYNPRITYRGFNYNEECYNKIPSVLGISDDAAWFVDEIYTNNQDELHFVAYVLDNERGKEYVSNEERKQAFLSKIRAEKDFNKAIRRQNIHTRDNSDLSLQQIFYGAPGTGKSHGVKEVTDKVASEFVFRTTFHPDSDYSTFVGAYKPTMEYPDNKAYTVGQLIDKLSEIKNTGCTYPCQKFAAKYWYALKQLSSAEVKEIIAACGFTDSMKVEIDKSIPVGEELAKNNTDSKIVYSFVPQAFLKAYVAAWKNPEEKVFLVIEEINRGNCAQIFGDIFQLLDRNDNGQSEYPIKADQDIRDHLAKEFAGVEDLKENIQSGEELVLPSNLHIWATMNTSDQSLFPIDSAFKRRWDWKYMPIHDAGENWTIALSDIEYDWWDFVEKINKVIGDMTSSEDKKLGYFFCKACNGKIDADKFVNKVVFYLWNDVFKDYELSNKAFDDVDGKLNFNKFYTPSGEANEETIIKFLENLEVEISEYNHEGEDDDELEDDSSPVISQRRQKCKEFWSNFLEYTQNNSEYQNIFGGRKTPTLTHWYTYSVFNRPMTHLCVDQFRGRNELSISIIMDKPSYIKLEESYKAEIEQKLQGISLVWTRDRQKSTKKSSIKEVIKVTDFDGPQQQELFNHIIDRLLRMYNVFNECLTKLPK